MRKTTRCRVFVWIFDQEQGAAVSLPILLWRSIKCTDAQTLFPDGGFQNGSSPNYPSHWAVWYWTFLGPFRLFTSNGSRQKAIRNSLTCFPFGYGSIATDTICWGTNIHWPAILMFTRGFAVFWPSKPLARLLVGSSGICSSNINHPACWATVRRICWDC